MRIGIAATEKGEAMEMIDRKSAINAVLGLKNCYNGFSDTYDKSCIVGLLEELPTIEAIPISYLKNTIDLLMKTHIDKDTAMACSIMSIIQMWRRNK